MCLIFFGKSCSELWPTTCQRVFCQQWEVTLQLMTIGWSSSLAFRCNYSILTWKLSFWYVTVWLPAVFLFDYISRREKKNHINNIQESPPAWTQEAYRPPRSHSKSLLFRGGGVPQPKIFFPIWTCIKPNLVSKIFPFTGGGGSLKKFFFPVWTCIKPNLVSKFFPFTVGGEGFPWQKIFFSSLNMYQAKSGVKIFSLYRGGVGGSLNQNFFFQSKHVSSQIWCQKIFPLPVGGSLNKTIFFQSEHVSSQIWCQNFFPLLVGGGESLYKKFFFPVWTCIRPNLVSKIFLFTGGGVPLQKIFFPVWTCIKPNLVSKIFPFTGGMGGSSTKIFFPSLNMYQAKSGVKNFSFYWWGGPSTKNFFSSLNMYQAKSGVKKFSLYWWDGGSLYKNFFSQSEHVSSQIWCQKFFFLLVGGSLYKKFFFQSEHVLSHILCQKFFPLLVGGGSVDKKFFFQSEHVSSQIWCQKFFFLLVGGVPLQKIFFPVWTCIKPKLVSKIFPFTGGGGVPQQKIFCQSEHVSSQIWCQNFFPLLVVGVPWQKKFFSSLNMYQAKSAVKNISLYWDRVPPPPPQV